eukprot:1505757-Amphidinium_carterae.1
MIILLGYVFQQTLLDYGHWMKYGALRTLLASIQIAHFPLLSAPSNVSSGLCKYGGGMTPQMLLELGGKRILTDIPSTSTRPLVCSRHQMDYARRICMSERCSWVFQWTIRFAISSTAGMQLK